MGAADEPQLIKPQVERAATQHVPTKEEKEAEKKRRIDEALARYTSGVSAGGVVSPGGGAATTQPQQAPAPHSEQPTPQPEKPAAPGRQSDAQYVAAHLDEVREVVNRMMSRAEPKKDEPDTQGQMIAPTAVDPEATIAQAVKELREREEEEAKQAAIDAEEQSRPTNRYRSDPVEHFMPTLHNRKRLITLAAVWLGAIPVALLLNVAVGWLGDSILATILFIIVCIFGAYGALGWIPLMVSYIRNNM